MLGNITEKDVHSSDTAMERYYAYKWFYIVVISNFEE